MNATYAPDLKDRLTQACYRNILPHLERYRAESYLEDCFPLLVPHLFAKFADQACHDVVRLVLQVAHGTYRQSTSRFSTLPAAVRQLEIEDADQARLHHELSPCLAQFHRTLDQYGPEFERFRQINSQAGNAALSHGHDVGTAVGQLAENLFGKSAGVVAAFAGGFLGGSVVMQQLQEEGERLQRGFTTMLKAYDDAMTALVAGSLAALDNYHQELASALHSGR